MEDNFKLNYFLILKVFLSSILKGISKKSVIIYPNPNIINETGITNIIKTLKKS